MSYVHDPDGARIETDAEAKLRILKKYSDRSRSGSSKDADKLKVKNRAKAKAARKARKASK